jgi:Asp-tRNA(Asn)/Glu-tRNA(Gln) amidotransferase A subunit family amidase
VGSVSELPVVFLAFEGSEMGRPSRRLDWAAGVAVLHAALEVAGVAGWQQPHVRKTGLEVRAVDYLLARQEVARIRQGVEDALGRWDALVLPATAVVAPPLSAPEARDALLRFTRPFSLTGHPCIVIPAPVTGLPVGIQVVGRIGTDARLAEIAFALERSWS